MRVVRNVPAKCQKAYLRDYESGNGGVGHRQRSRQQHCSQYVACGGSTGAGLLVGFIIYIYIACVRSFVHRALLV